MSTSVPLLLSVQSHYLSFHSIYWHRQWQPHSQPNTVYSPKEKIAAMVKASALPRFTATVKILPFNFTCSSNLLPNFPGKRPQALWSTFGASNGLQNGVVRLAGERKHEQINVEEFDVHENSNDQLDLGTETLLYAFSPFPVLQLAGLLAGGTLSVHFPAHASFNCLFIP